MTDQFDNGGTRINEEPEGWSWNKRPGIKTNQPKKDFAFNSAEAVRQALGQGERLTLRPGVGPLDVGHCGKDRSPPLGDHTGDGYAALQPRPVTV